MLIRTKIQCTAFSVCNSGMLIKESVHKRPTDLYTNRPAYTSMCTICEQHTSGVHEIVHKFSAH